LNEPGTNFPTGLRLLLDEEGVQITNSRPIDHGTQYDLARNGETAKLNVYHTGKVSTGGRASGLRDLLDGWRTSQKKTTGTRAPARPSGARPILDGTPRLGIDEAGKGDYFGPLVVAGVRIADGDQAKSLQEIGVRDSKEISVLGVRGLSERILGAVGPDNVCVVSLSPPEYEVRREAAGNVNSLLGEIDAGIIVELAGEVEVVVVDEFARSARDHLEPFVPGGVRLEVRPRAEDDAAVAAASILARHGNWRRSNTSRSGSASGYLSARRTSWMRAAAWSKSWVKTVWPGWLKPTSRPPAGCSNNIMEVSRDRSSQRHRDPSDGGNAAGDAGGAGRR